MAPEMAYSTVQRLEALTRLGNLAQIDWVWAEARSQFESQTEYGEPNGIVDCFENALDLLGTQAVPEPDLIGILADELDDPGVDTE